MATTLGVARLVSFHSTTTDGVDLPGVIESIGSAACVDRLLSYVNGKIGADRFLAFELKEFKLVELASTPEIADEQIRSELRPYEVKRQLRLAGRAGIHVDIGSVPSKHSRISSGWHSSETQRITISGRHGETVYIILVLRSGNRAPMTDEQVSTLVQSAAVLMSIFAKHVDVTACQPAMAPPFSSVERIEDCINSASRLSRREREVCARTLYGLSSCGIALDLGIGRESVVTYRKRAYQRLGIASQRELLMWYLSLWSRSTSERAATASTMGPSSQKLN